MNKLFRYFWLAVKVLVFLLVLGFALKNSQPVVFHAYLGAVWEAPLVVMLGVAFVLGIGAGLAALLPALFRQRRELARLRRAPRENPVAPADDDLHPV